MAISIKLRRRFRGFDVLAHDGDKQVGLLQVDYPRPGRAIIQAVDVDEEYRRQGIATRMFALARRTMSNDGITGTGAALEGSGMVQILERTFGPGNTTYRKGGGILDADASQKIMDVDFGRLIADSKLLPYKKTRRAPAALWMRGQCRQGGSASFFDKPRVDLRRDPGAISARTEEDDGTAYVSGNTLQVWWDKIPGVDTEWTQETWTLPTPEQAMESFNGRTGRGAAAWVRGQCRFSAA
jgi:hypothetical protein